MVKKTSSTTKPVLTEEQPVIPPGAAYAGGVLFAVGFVAFYLSGRAHPGVFTWHSYVSIGILVVGGLLWFTSGMDKVHLVEWIRSALICSLH